MKNLLLVLSLMFSFFGFENYALAQTQKLAMPVLTKKGDFRGFVWGVSKADVRKFETAVFYEEKGDSLYFLDRPSKNDVVRKIRYNFMGDALISARYEFQGLHFTAPDMAVGFYDDIRRHVSKSKGPYEKEDFVWRDQTYKRYPQFWGRAVRMGDLVMKTIWMDGTKTETTLMLRYDRPYYVLVYDAKRVDGAAQNLFEIPRATNPVGAPSFNP